MKKLDIYLENKEDLVEKYNKEHVSNELIKYILSQIEYVDEKDRYELYLHVTKETKNCADMIKKGLKEEYNKNLKKSKITNIKQIILILISIIILLFSTLVNAENILHEIIIIIGWVPIWEAVELEIITDARESRRRKILKKLMQSHIIEVALDSNTKQ